MTISVTVSGNFSNTERYLKRASRMSLDKILDKYGRLGVEALERATPKDSGKTANSWEYRVVGGKTRPSIEWYNTNVNDNVVVAIVIQYGHATRSGSYVQGIDYVNPAMREVFEKISRDVWKEVRG
jgi:hypothetical protein